MVATNLLISVCVGALIAAAGAAPQQRFGEPNEQNLVGDVVTALQPSIAAAVADALASFTRGSVTTTSSQGSTSAVSGEAVNAAAGGVSGSVSPVDEATGRAVYAYQYQVSDDLAQTYITQNEARDGDEVTGAYSYVDPNGDLITVNYQAGVDGFTQTIDRQAGAVQIRAKPAAEEQQLVAQNVQTTASRSAGVANNRQSAVSSNRQTAVTNNRQSAVSSINRQSAVNNQQRQTAAASSVSESSLIAEILAALQPQISAAVNTAVAGQ